MLQSICRTFGLPDIPLLHRCLITLAFAAIIVALSIVPARIEPKWSVISRLVMNIAAPVQKILHVVIYAMLVVLSMWMLEFLGSRALGGLLSVMVAIGLGVLLEWCQLSVPGRYGTFSDILLNGAGAGAGLLLALILL